MAWTNPTTRSSGHVVTAAEWDTDIVDNLLALSTHAHTGAAGDGASILIPDFGNDKRMSLLYGVPPGNVTGDQVVTEALNGSIAAAWDATNKFIYNQFQVTSNGGYARCNSQQSVSTQLLPACTFGFAHVSTTTCTVRMGMMDGVASADPNNGIFFRAVNNGNWFAVCRQNAGGGPETATDTGIAASTTAKEFRISVDAVGSVTFYIDDVLKATITTNIPATTVLLQLRQGYTTSGAGTFNAAFAQWMGWSFETKSS